jgi:hypothetical protein
VLEVYRSVDAALVSEGEAPMGNAKHIGCMWALAVAVGVGMAVANTPAVALAAPADSGKGSSSNESSPSGSSRQSGPKSSDTPSAHRASSTSDDAAGHRRRQMNPPDKTAVTSSTEPAGTPAPGFTPKKTRPKPVAVNAAAADPTVRGSSPAFTPHVPALTAAAVSSTPDAPAVASHPTASTGITRTPAAPPTAPVQEPAALTLLAFARREFEQGLRIPPTTVNPLAGHTATSAADPDFISSTHDLGLFSVTSAADPDDNHYVAFVLATPLFTNVLTSGTDPEDNLGFGAASIGVAGQTVNTFISPFLNFSIAIPVTDPFAELFTELVRLGF